VVLPPSLHGHAALERAEAIEEEDAVEVIDLVLQGSREEAVGLNGD
jgi:hypothetical protein